MKKKLSFLLVIAMVIGMFAGMAFPAAAEETGEPVLQIYSQNGENGVQILEKAYTAEDLAALTEKNEKGYGYVYYKNDAANAVAATEFVALDKLLADAGTSFEEGDSLAITCSDGPYTKDDFSYETMSKRGVDLEGSAVPTALATTWENGSLEDGTVQSLAEKAKNTGNIRLVSGMTEAEKTDKTAAGRRMPTGVVAITVVKPETAVFAVYTQAGDQGEPKLLKEYMAADLAALTEKKADGYGYVYYKNDAANAVAATEYVALDKLLADAGATFEAGGRLAITCSDGPYTKGDFSYETMAKRGVDPEGNVVPTALAITWENGSLEDGTVQSLAEKAKNTGSIRLVSGMTEEEKTEKTAAGNRMPTGVISISVITPVPLPFTDVVAGSYYENAVRWAVEKAVTEGTSDTTFSPDSECTRAQMVTFLWRAEGKPEAKDKTNPFNDIKEGAYYYDAVLWAVENGITTGTGDETFSPEDIVTRAQTVTFLFRHSKAEAPANASAFTDLKAGSYYEDAVNWAADKGVAMGMSDTTFEPDTICNRAQIVTFLSRYFA